MWVGTLGGLAKFNGHEFKTFSPNDGILNNRIQTLFYDDGTLWIGHDGGISFKENNVIRKIEFSGTEKSRNVSEIVRFKDKILVCTNGGGLYQVVNNKFVSIKLPSEDAKAIRGAKVSGNHLYLATKSGVLKTSDLRKFVYETGIERGSYFDVEANAESQQKPSLKNFKTASRQN